MTSIVPHGDGSGALLDAALNYARYGWSVFPCRANKQPITPNGFLDADRDEDRIRTWWGLYPHAAIGVACGASNLVVLDYDPAHDAQNRGQERLRDLLSENETRQARTGSGGQHYYFRAPAGATVRNSAGRLGDGIDVRGDGGYVIAPPSANERGPYAWINDARLLPLPPAVLTALEATAPPAAPERSSRAERDMIPSGRRNETLASMAGTLRRRGMSPLAVEQALLAENQEHCEEPLPETEVLAIARSIARYAPGSLPVVSPDAHSTEPAVEVLGADAVRISVALTDQTRAAFSFTEMEKERRELSCHLAVAFVGGGEPYQQRINLESSSQRTELRRELDNLYGRDRGWAAALNTVWSLARQAYLAQDRSASVAVIPRLVGARDLIAPLMPSEGITILFGDGSASKSYLCLGLALVSAAGIPLAGVYTAPRCNVLYIDYEDSDANFRRRTDRILAGVGMTVQDAQGLFYWRARGIPLRDQWDGIRRSCEQNNIGWIIVDSVAPAAGGAPEEAQTALGFFSAVERIGRPCLAVAHITKSTGPEASQKPLGSSYWSNSARRTWFVARSQEEGADDIQTALYCRKANDGPKPRPLGFRVHFEGEEGPVTFTAADPSSDHELAKHGSNSSQIWGVLTEPRTLAEIEDLTGIGANVARVTMKRQPERFTETAHVASGERGRPAAVWSRVHASDQQHSPRGRDPF